MRTDRSLWKRMSGPVKIGLAFAVLGMILAAIGLFRGFAPLTLRSVTMALLISGVSWGVVAWAIAAAAVAVEKDVQGTDQKSIRDDQELE